MTDLDRVKDETLARALARAMKADAEVERLREALERLLPVVAGPDWDAREQIEAITQARAALTEGKGCPFCDYSGPSPIIADYTQEGVFIIEPLNPVVSGHVLVIPRRHVEHFANDLEVTGNVAMVAADYARGRWETDFNLITSKGSAATQTVPHLHSHLIPRRENDGLALPWTIRAEKEVERLKEALEGLIDAAYAYREDDELLAMAIREARAALTPPSEGNDDG